MVNEFAVLMLLGAAAVSLSWLLKLRDFWLMLPAGMLALVTVRAGSFALLNLLNLRDWANPVFYLVLFAILLLAAWRVTPGFYGALWLGVGLGFASALLTRVFNLTTLAEADALWTLSVTRLFDESSSLTKLSELTGMQHGYGYPLMLALGEPGEFLTGYTTLLFAALLSSAVWAVKTLVGYANKVNLILALAVGSVALSTVMVARTIFYVSGHNLNAIAFLLAATAVAIALRDAVLSNSSFTILAISLTTANFNAIEAPVFGLLILIPLLSRRWLQLRQLLWLSAFIALPYLIWMGSYRAIAIKTSGLPWWAFAAIVLVALFAAIYAFAKLDVRLRIHAVWVTPALLALTIAVCWFAVGDRMTRGWIALFDNLFAGTGSWGSLAYFIVAGFLLLLLTGRANWSEEFKSLSWSFATLALGSIVIKTFATSGSGDIALRRFGWSDSLNRLWFELMAIALVALIVGASQRLERQRLLSSN